MERQFTYPEGSPSSHAHKSIAEFCKPYYERLGICYFHLFRYYNDDKMIHLCPDMSLDDYYWTHSDSCSIPENINESPLNEFQVVAWRDTYASYMENGLARECGLIDPIVVYSRRADSIEFFVFASPIDSENNYSNYLINFTELKQMIADFKSGFTDLIESATEQRAPAPKTNIQPQFDLQPLTVNMEGKYGPASLTAKEFEVLNLLVRGLSSREIAEKLERSARTVETHTASIKEKTGYNKKSELICQAIAQLYKMNLRADKVFSK